LKKVVCWTLFENDEAAEYDVELIESYWRLRAGALTLMAAEEEMEEMKESTVPLSTYEALLTVIEEELIHERKVCLFGSLSVLHRGGFPSSCSRSKRSGMLDQRVIAT